MRTARRARRYAWLRRRLSRVVLLATGAVVAAGSSDAVPEARPVPSRQTEVASQIVVEEALTAVEAPPAPDDPTPPGEPFHSALAPLSRESGAGESASAEGPAPPTRSDVPLESLLRAPPACRPLELPLDLRVFREESVAPRVPASPGALDRWKDRVRVKRRSDAIGPAGPRQGTVYETEAGLRFPLDDSLSLEGGVRVDQRDKPGVEEPDRKSTPRVGVEMRF